MKAALCQTDIKWENKEKNLAEAEKYTAEAAENGAELIIFPEMSFTGFTMNVEKYGEEFASSETLEKIKKTAADNKIAVGFGMAVKENKKNLNRFVVVDKDGSLLGFYDKIHPFSYGDEGKYFTGGENLLTVKIGDTRLSCYVCYDLRFPEIFSAAADKSDLLVIIANWPASRINQWTHLLRARAVENQCYTVGINRTGEGGGISYNGKTALIDPYGNIMAQRDSAPGITYCEILPENVAYYRNKFKMRADRREELYISLFEENIKNKAAL